MVLKQLFRLWCGGDWLLQCFFVIKVKKMPIIVEIKKLSCGIPVICRGYTADSELER